MVASEFEYRHHFWMIALVYVVAYAFYNLDHLNILYSIVPWNRGVVQRDMLVRFFYAAAALLAACGAVLLTWATAYRPPGAGPDHTTFSTGGPFRYVRNPHYLAYFFLLLALGTFQSRFGFPIMLLTETVLLFRLVAREEFRLKQEYGERFSTYAQRVPRFLPSLQPRFEDEGELARWPQALWDQAFQWGFVATLLAFAFTLSDPIGYAFAFTTIAFLVLQKLARAFWVRLRRTCCFATCNVAFRNNSAPFGCPSIVRSGQSCRQPHQGLI
jgi:protein-S-isoprenylcysteine O-methyltransferase Ste14